MNARQQYYPPHPAYRGAPMPAPIPPYRYRPARLMGQLNARQSSPCDVAGRPCGEYIVNHLRPLVVPAGSLPIALALGIFIGWAIAKGQ